MPLKELQAAVEGLLFLAAEGPEEVLGLGSGLGSGLGLGLGLGSGLGLGLGLGLGFGAGGGALHRLGLPYP